MYVAATKSYAWQEVVSMLFVTQFLIDVLFLESVVCFCVHFLAPYLHSTHIQSAFKILLDTATYLCKLKRTKWLTHATPSLDAPRYFFPSVMLSKEYPNLVESALIHSYHTHTLPNTALAWAGVLPKNKSNSSVISTIASFGHACFFAVLAIFVTTSTTYVKLTVQFLTILPVLVLAIFLKQDVSRSIVIAYVGSACLFFFVISLRYHYRRYLKRRSAIANANNFEVEESLFATTPSKSPITRNTSMVYPGNFTASSPNKPSPNKQVEILSWRQKNMVVPFWEKGDNILSSRGDDLSMSSTSPTHNQSKKIHPLKWEGSSISDSPGKRSNHSHQVFPHDDISNSEVQNMNSSVFQEEQRVDDLSVSTDNMQFDQYDMMPDFDFSAFELEMEEAVRKLELEAEEASLTNSPAQSYASSHTQNHSPTSRFNANNPIVETHQQGRRRSSDLMSYTTSPFATVSEEDFQLDEDGEESEDIDPAKSHDSLDISAVFMPQPTPVSAVNPRAAPSVAYTAPPAELNMVGHQKQIQNSKQNSETNIVAYSQPPLSSPFQSSTFSHSRSRSRSEHAPSSTSISGSSMAGTRPLVSPQDRRNRLRTSSIPPWMHSGASLWQPDLDFDFDAEMENAISNLERIGLQS